MTTTVTVSTKMLKEMANLLDLAADIAEDAKVGSAAAQNMRNYVVVIQHICEEQEKDQ